MLTISDILSLTRGRLLAGDLKAKVSSVSTDTRTLAPGALFVTLKGKNFDGHRFVSLAIRKGAAALLVSRPVLLSPRVSVPVICVNDPQKAYGDLARGFRERFKIPVVAITGSVGKTTTKELIAAVLSSQRRVLKNRGTENNEIGVAKTLLGLRPRHQVAVLEFGTNHFGEIARLASIGRPTVAVLTNIGESHLEFLKDRRGVFKEKSALVKALEPKDTVLYNSDDDLLRTLGKKHAARSTITFALDRDASYRATNIIFKKDHLCFSVGRHAFCLKTLSRDNVNNALAAIAIGRLFGLSWKTIAQALRRAKFPRGRQNILKVSGVVIIDDTYNANPTSVAGALATLRRFPSSGKRIFVFGDMRELGTAASRAHGKIGKLAAAHKVDLLLTYGRWSRRTSQEATKNNISCIHCKTHDAVVRELRKAACPGDVILVKGSRGMRMEKVVEKIKPFHF